MNADYEKRLGHNIRMLREKRDIFHLKNILKVSYEDIFPEYRDTNNTDFYQIMFFHLYLLL